LGLNPLERARTELRILIARLVSIGYLLVTKVLS